MLLVIAIIAATLRLATPLIFASLGGVFSERSGVVNIALEGIMINGAFFSILATEFTDIPFIGVIAAMISGILTSLILAYFAIHLKANQVVVGTAINLLAASFTAYLLELIWHRSGQTNPVKHAIKAHPIPFIENIPILGDLTSQLTVFVYLAFIAVIISYYVLYKTPFGLRVRSVGEHPRAADTVGINVYKIRYKCVMISGALAGLAGATLSLGTVRLFKEGMTAGKGFIALAAVIFGKWHPIGAMLACLFFGFTEALKIQSSAIGLGFLPSELLNAIPYIATILALAGFVGKAVGPAASGESYEKGDK
ncbi:ABC transporter permease [Abyssisolibacter fermentans]|uniref:ABC transporter permease n=1 Tax=Abyssisolibacter fermentans TaxID=1766203 RepID=UPI00083237E1|nr:ABC transporter permease [Abyssisolibacter fermentans]